MTIYFELFEAIEQGVSERISGWVHRALDEVLDGRQAARAVSHPLGFVCLPLHRSRDQGVCVHLWGPRWRRATPTTSQTHCHSWELLSWVLTGELRNQTIRVIDGTESPTRRVFEVHSDATGDEIRATGRLVRHEVRATTTHRTGEAYRLPAGVFHETLVPETDDPVITVALGLTTSGVADLSLGELHTTSHYIRRELCSEQDTIQAAEAVKQAITVSQ
jgi:hypothetical protein